MAVKGHFLEMQNDAS